MTPTLEPPPTASPPKSGDGGAGPASEARRAVVAELRRNWIDEMRSSELYRRLAGSAPSADHRDVLLQMSAQELRHAAHWEERLVELGGTIPRLRRGPRDVLIPALARVAGLPSVISLIEGGETRGKLNYLRQARHLPDARSRQIASEILPDERRHQDAATRLRTATPGTGARSARTYIGDFVRDAIFGLNDGLVSNFSLIAGVSGANPPRGVVVLSGVAGLIAGAVSMATGSYLSTKSEQEVIDEEVRRKREEIEYDPEAEREEVRRIYRLKGFADEEVEMVVRRITANPERWLETLVTEEMGINTHQEPPPALHGTFTGAGFGLGALVPIVPYLFATGTAALVVAALLSIAALFAVGAAKSLFTGRSATRSGAEMVVVGVAAGAFTNGVGRLFGQSVG